MAPVKIVLVEWMGYPLFRRKNLGSRSFECGLGNLIRNISRFDAGVEHELTVLVNECPPGWASWLNHVPGIGALALNATSSNSRKKYEDFVKRYPETVRKLRFRSNHLQDIGAYDEFYRGLCDEGHEGDVLFANSSVRGPNEDGWLLKYRTLFEMEPDTGMCGISLNSHNTMDESLPFAPHLQSFFLYTNMTVLEKVFPQGLVDREEQPAQDKLSLIERGEIGLSTRVLRANLGLRSSMFPDFFYKTGTKWSIPEGDLRFQEEFFNRANVC